MPDKFSLLVDEINLATSQQVPGGCRADGETGPTGSENNSPSSHRNQSNQQNLTQNLSSAQAAYSQASPTSGQNIGQYSGPRSGLLFGQNSNEPQVTFLRSGEVISSNFVWQRIFGDDGLGGQVHNLFDLLDPVAAEDLRRTIVQVSKLPHVTANEFSHPLPSGNHWFAWSVRFDPERNCFHSTGIDIGPRRRQHEIFETITQRVSQCSGKELFESVATELAKTFQLERVGISKVDGEMFQTIAFADRFSVRKDVRYPVRDSICEKISRWGGVHQSVNPIQPAPACWDLIPNKTLTYVGCPIFSLDRSSKVGLIWAVSYNPINDVALLEWLLLSLSVRVAAELERVSKEEELERQLAYNQAILRASPDLFFVLSPDLVYTDFICRSIDELIAPPENIIGHKMVDLLPPDVYQKFVAAHERSLLTGEVSVIDYELDTIGGHRESYEARVLVNRDQTGLQFVRNTTAENNLRFEQKRLTSILEASPDICLILSFDGKLNYINPAGRKFLNITSDRTVGLSDWHSLIQPASSAQLFIDVFAPAALRDGTWRGDAIYCDSHEVEVPFSQLIIAHPAVGSSDGYYSVVLRDMSDRRNFESKIQEQQLQIMSSAKMAALGEMAAGIAHEINNPLASIMARAQVLGEMAHERPTIALERMCDFTDKISQMSERIARIIRSLRFFARDGEMDPIEARPLRELIDETLELCRARFRSQNVNIEVKLESESLVIWSRPVQISQVLLNLLSNAFDAVTQLDERWVVIEAKKSPQGLVLSVTDSGSGIQDAIASKIMLPFFTTKEVGAGTGLGLSISSGIIQGHGGALHLDRASPNTRFVVSLPQNEMRKTGAGAQLRPSAPTTAIVQN